MMKNAAYKLAITIVSAQILAVTLLSQARDSKPTPNAPEDSIVVVPGDEVNKIENKDSVFPARGGAVDWGLALSGGGIRSGAFSIGVLKALYDGGYLDNIDVVSSVSGGGFAAYWMYGLLDDNSQHPFGSTAFDDGHFLSNTCNLQTRSDMYSLGKMLGAFFQKRSSAFDKYMASIQRTFGLENTVLEDKRIGEYRAASRSGQVPYFIINTSLNAKGLPVQSVEVTPDYIGNDKLGYGRWTSSPLFGEAITWSAAGIKFKLKQEVPNFAPDKAPDKNFNLYDGGWSENSGALPLIRRGIKNVIVIDAEHDPKYGYDAYFKLKKILKEQYQIELTVCDIGQELGKMPTNIVLKGTAKRSGEHPIDTSVYWVKMTRPDEVFPKTREDDLRAMKSWKEAESSLKNWYAAGFTLASQRNTAIGVTDSHTNDQANCVAAPKAPADPAMYIWLANRYRYRLAETHWEDLRFLGKGGVYEFPQLSTWDQSYYPDQMEAFIGLGFLEGRTLIETLKSDASTNMKAKVVNLGNN